MGLVLVVLLTIASSRLWTPVAFNAVMVIAGIVVTILVSSQDLERGGVPVSCDLGNHRAQALRMLAWSR